MAKMKNEEGNLIILGKRKAVPSTHLKASVENGLLFSDSDTKAPKMKKKAKKEKKATKGTKQKGKGKTKESSDEEVEVVDGTTVIK